MKPAPFSLDSLKRKAKRLSKQIGISHCQALDKLAVEMGCRDYHHLVSGFQPYGYYVPPVYLEQIKQAKKANHIIVPASYFQLPTPRNAAEFILAYDINETCEFLIWDESKGCHKEHPALSEFGFKYDPDYGDKVIGDFLAIYPDKTEPSYHMDYFQFWKLKFPEATNFGMVCEYAMTAFFFPPSAVICQDKVYMYRGLEVLSYDDWIKEYGIPEPEEIEEPK